MLQDCSGPPEPSAGWNATVAQHGAGITATSLGDNASIARGRSQSFGIKGTSATGDAPSNLFWR